MKIIKKTFLVKLIFIVIFSIIIFILFATFDKETNYLTFNHKIESITEKDNGLYLTFYDDEEDDEKNIEYVIYKSNVNLDLLKDIKVGDIVNITVEDNYGKFKYTIIYQMKYNDEILFNITDKYSQLGDNNRILFISFFASMILFIILFTILPGEKEGNTPHGFVIKNPSWQRNTFLGFILGGIGFILPFTILFLLEKCDFSYFAYSFVFYIFLSIGILGIYVCIREKFIFKDNVFTYVKPFGKTRSVKITDLKSIILITSEVNKNSIFMVEFYNHNHIKCLWFLDNGTAFKDGYLQAACKRFNVNIIRIEREKIKKTYDKKYYNSKKIIEYIKFFIKYGCEPELSITNDKDINYTLVCYRDYVDLQDEKGTKTFKIEDINKYVNFEEKLYIDSDINFDIPLEKQVEIVDDKLQFIPKIR